MLPLPSTYLVIPPKHNFLRLVTILNLLLTLPYFASL